MPPCLPVRSDLDRCGLPPDALAPDSELVARAVAGDSAAFGALYERHRSRVLRFAAARLRDPEEARDVVQETFLEALRALPQYRGEAPLWSWLAGIAYHRICAHYRTRVAAPRDAAFAEEPVCPAAFVDDALDARRSLARCEAVLASGLSAEQQRIFHLRYGQNRSINSIARTVSRSRESVKVGLFRARRKLLREVPDLAGGAGI